MAVDNSQIILAYRGLYRSALHAVQYSKPARYIVRNNIEKAFRSDSRSNFNTKRIGNTILFLENAAKVKGLEHRILKNLVHVRWWQMSHHRRSQNKYHTSKVAEFEATALRQYEVTLQMLNDSMDMCLR